MKLVLKDTTFRDGIQGKGVEVGNLNEALRAIVAIDNCGVAYHEVGFATAGDASYRRIVAACGLKLRGQVCGFGRTHADDVAALLQLRQACQLPVAVLVGKSRARDAAVSLRKTREDNLELISSSVAALVDAGLEVIFDAEHFFDAYWHDDQSYALEGLRAALNAGASWLVLCDTNGRSTPEHIQAAIQTVGKIMPVDRLGIHTHNDRGRAIANAEAAFLEGVQLIEGTCGGVGERTGNMDWTTFGPNTVVDYAAVGITPEQLQRFHSTYLLLCDVLNVSPRDNQPWVGPAAFHTEAGMHQSGENRDAGSYLHADPSMVGNRQCCGVTDQSGWANIVTKARELGFELNGVQRSRIMAAYNRTIADGGNFGEADASLYLFLCRVLGQLPLFFDLISYRIIDGYTVGQETVQEASLRLILDGEPKLHNADGDGPVDALTNALRRTLHRRYPELGSIKLTGYKSHAIDLGTGARVRTIITFSDGEKTWTTMGVHTDSTRAAFQAIVDGFMYKLMVNGRHQAAALGVAAVEEAADLVTTP